MVQQRLLQQQQPQQLQGQQRLQQPQQQQVPQQQQAQIVYLPAGYNTGLGVQQQQLQPPVQPRSWAAAGSMSIPGLQVQPQQQGGFSTGMGVTMKVCSASLLR